jgi:hypothetical protein
MTTRSQITMEPELTRRARRRAEELGVSFAEYVRRAVIKDLGEKSPKPDVSAVFDLSLEGPSTDIARDKDRMIADAILTEHSRKAGMRRKSADRTTKPRR